MTPPELQYKQPWLEEAEKRLTSLCGAFEAGADDGDILPTSVQQTTVLEFLRKVARTDGPKIGTTTNADLTLTWVTASDKYKVFIEPTGKVTCFHNKETVKQDEFCSLVARVLA